MLNAVKSRFLSGKKILVIVLMFVAVSANAQWVQMSNGMGNVKYINGFTSNATYLFTVTDSNGVFRSSNNGVNWVAVNNGLPLLNNRCITSKGTNIFVGTIGGGVYKTTNNGDNWTTVNNGLTNLKVLSFAVNGINIYAGTGSPTGSIFRSTNDGTNWTQVFIMPSQGAVGYFAVNGINVFAAPSFLLNSKVYMSSNNGVNWLNMSSSLLITAIISSGANLFIGTFNGIGISTNNGANFSAAGLQQYFINDFAVSGTNLFAGTDTGGVFLSTNNGTNWIAKNQGLESRPYVAKLFIYNNYIYDGELYVWRRSLSEIISVQNISTEVPSAYSLSQNYPNPFNPTTTIKFSVPQVSSPHGVGGDLVLLKIFDVSGREVETLVNEQLQPGTYSTQWNASAFSTGVYFYKIQAGDFSETKRMLIVK